jgi:hypothetical protein
MRKGIQTDDEFHESLKIITAIAEQGGIYGKAAHQTYRDQRR